MDRDQAGDDDELDIEGLDLAEVRRRLRPILEVRRMTSLDRTTQSELERLLRREAELLERDASDDQV